MPTLTLLRHAKSSWQQPELADFDRPLNARGQRDAPRMAAELVRRGLAPSHVWLSPAVRTRQTAAALLPLLPPHQLSTPEWLYHAQGALLAHELSKLSAEVTHLLLIGHQPGLGELAGALSPALPTDLPTGACLSLELGSWAGLEGARARFFVFPKGL